MKCNEAGWDRAVRIALGTALVSLGWVNGWEPALIAGSLQLATGVGGYCVLYEPFRVDTRTWFRRRAG